MKKILIVLGMHRSGTSVVTQICKYIGGYLGEQSELMPATKYNPNGYFENEKIFCINNKILNCCDREWYNVEPLELDYNNPKVAKAMDELKLIIQNLLQKKDIIVIKDPRISILLHLWRKILDDLKVEVKYIWVYRNPLEVAESLRKRDGFSESHSLLLWIYYNLSILKFIKKKDYFLVNYRDVLENPKVFDKISCLFGKKMDSNLKERLCHVVTQEYCHSKVSNQDVYNKDNPLLTEVYDFLLKKAGQSEKVSAWIEIYKKQIDKIEDSYVDYEIFEDKELLKNKELIIYGAGNYGRLVVKMLQQLGVLKFNFCDRDVNKHGASIMGGNVFSIKSIENKKNLLFIVALNNENQRKEVEQTLSCMEGVKILSFFALSKFWKYSVDDYKELSTKIKAASFWYQRVSVRLSLIQSIFENPEVLVYQNGKVGSSSVSQSLQNSGTKSLHIHRIFFRNDIVKELILGDQRMNSERDYCFVEFQKNLSYFKEQIRHKKIITLVRDPIAVDLSTVFQWIGGGDADRYFTEQLNQGKYFLQVVAELMKKIQNRLFNWFDEELKELCGIDVFEYPFDREKGYTIIKKDDIEVLLLKTEKLSEMTEIIRSFTGNYQFKLSKENIGESKEYAHIYRGVRKNLVLAQEYVDFYYKGNVQVSHFYNDNEIEYMKNKWITQK